jgi:RNA polymerase sigma-70 factor (ECF subfamily)
MTEVETDEELLRAAAHDPKAFAAFYRRHAQAMLTYLRRRTGDMEAAADLTADVFAAAFESRRRFRPRSEPARAWLFGIANNLLAMDRRTRARAAAARRRLGLERIAFLDDELERVEAAISAQVAGDVAALVADLPDDQREAVLARVVEERDYREIARLQGCSETVVRQRVSRGLARVGLALGKEKP